MIGGWESGSWAAGEGGVGAGREVLLRIESLRVD